MMLVPPFFTPILSPALALSVLLELDTLPQIQIQQQQPLPVIEVIKVYGKLAGPTCFGKVAPKGSSCQITSSELKKELGILSTSTSTSTSAPGEVRITREEMSNALDALPFQWPLKPYGRDKSSDKTAVINKGAETYLYMEQLESRGLYDRRNPAGPLPTSLRPQLNGILQKEGLKGLTVDRMFGILSSSGNGCGGDGDGDGDGDGEGDSYITNESIENLSMFTDEDGRHKDSADYYDFVRLLGSDSISWD
eukprot:783952_1